MAAIYSIDNNLRDMRDDGISPGLLLEQRSVPVYISNRANIVQDIFLWLQTIS